MIVLDASVVVKWFANESDSAEARALLRAGAELIAPELVQVEVASALVRKSIRQQMTLEEVRQALRYWFAAVTGGQLVLLPDADHLPAAAEMSIELAHPLPDCLYLAIAQALGADLVTADRKFARRAATRCPAIRLLGG